MADKKRYFLTGIFGKAGAKDYEVDVYGAPIKKNGKNVFLSSTKGFSKWNDKVKPPKPVLEKKKSGDVDTMMQAVEAAATKRKERESLPMYSRLGKTKAPEATKIGGITGKKYVKGTDSGKYTPSKEVEAAISGTPINVKGNIEKEEIEPMNIRSAAVKRAKEIKAARQEPKDDLVVDAITKADDPERFSVSKDYGDVHALDDTGRQYKIYEEPKRGPEFTEIKAAGPINLEERKAKRIAEMDELKSILAMDKDDIEHEYGDVDEETKLLLSQPIESTKHIWDKRSKEEQLSEAKATAEANREAEFATKPVSVEINIENIINEKRERVAAMENAVAENPNSQTRGALSEAKVDLARTILKKDDPEFAALLDTPVEDGELKTKESASMAPELIKYDKQAGPEFDAKIKDMFGEDELRDIFGDKGCSQESVNLFKAEYEALVEEINKMKAEIARKKSILEKLKEKKAEEPK